MRILELIRSHTRTIIVLLIVIILLALIVPFFGKFVYVLETVEQQEVGVRFHGGRIKDIVGPGVYSDVGMFVSIMRVSSMAIPFTVRDEEIITKDKQLIGLVVSGDIFRPGLEKKDVLLKLWPQYRGIYLDEELATARVQDLARQSMKVCVGDRTFDENVVGTSRDELRACIDSELNGLSEQLGLQVQNLVVPEVVLSPEVRVALDAIVQSRLLTEKASQDKLKADAEALADQAKQEGVIRVEQSRVQEQTRQQTVLAELEQQRLEAQLGIIEAERANELATLEKERAVIDATKANELLAAERDLEINEAMADAAIAKAQADLAYQKAEANLYASSPEYLQLQIATVNASALSELDKIIFTAEGTTPTVIMPGPGIVPTVNTMPE